MAFSANNSQASLELLELDSFDTAFAVSAGRRAEVRRRFMTLFVDAGASRAYGSSGYVCKAFNSMGETFAVKRLRLDRSATPQPGEVAARFTQGQRSAFEEEYRSQLQLSHMRGFPRLYGLGYAGDEPVIVMEWVEGVTLEEARRFLPLAGAGVDPGVVAHLGLALASVLEGLDHLAERPVHRDISPRNIMLRTHERSLEEQVASGDFDLCLIDFGSATVAGTSDTRFTMLTDVWRNGTPEYAPPEMLTHDVPDIEHLRQSPSIDVYAVASVLYELLAGHTPFRIDMQKAKSPYRVKTETCPEPLPDRFGALGEAVMQGLQRDQTARCSAAQMRALCSRFLGEGEPRLAAQVASEWIPPVADFESAHLAMQGAGSPAHRPPVPLGAPAASRSAPLGNSATPRYATTAGASQQAHSSVRGTRNAQPAARPIPRRRFVAAAAGIATVAVVGGLAGALRPWEWLGENAADGEPEARDRGSSGGTVAYEGGTLLLAQDADTMLWGYVNSQRQWVVAPQFEKTPGFFSEGLAFAQDDNTGLFGYIDYNGAWAIEPRFSTAGTFFEDGLAPVQAHGEYDDLLGWVDKTGAWAIEPFCQSGGAFREGFASFSLDEATSTAARYGFINTKGNTIIEPKFFEAGAFSSEGLAACAEHVSSWGWVDSTGAWAIEPSFWRAERFSDGLAAAMEPWSELWGYVDTSGAWAIEPTFASARGFSAGMAAVKDAESARWGCIDAAGTWVVEPVFTQLGEFSHGLAPAQDARSQMFGYIDDQGQWVISPTFASVGLPAVE